MASFSSIAWLVWLEYNVCLGRVFPLSLDVKVLGRILAVAAMHVPKPNTFSLKIGSPKPHRLNSMPAASRGCALRRGCCASLSHGSRTCRDISNRDTFPTARIFLSQFSKHARSQRPGHFVALGSSVAKMEFGNVIQGFRPSNWPASYHRASSVRSRNLSSGTASMGLAVA